MRRTELMQEIRRMRFEEAYEGWAESRLTQEEAAMLAALERSQKRRYWLPEIWAIDIRLQ